MWLGFFLMFTYLCKLFQYFASINIEKTLLLLMILMTHLIICAVLLNAPVVFATEKCAKEAFDTVIIIGHQVSRSLIVWFPANVGSISKFDKCGQETGKPLERSCINHSGKAKWFENNTSSKYINCKDFVPKCNDETFEHNYRNEDNKLEKYQNKWLSVRTGDVGYLQKPCYLNTGLLLTRHCRYNPKYFIAEWEILDQEKEHLNCWKKKLSAQQQMEILNKYEVPLDELSQATLFSLSQDVKQNHQLHITNPSDVVKTTIHLLKTNGSKRSPAHIKAMSDILKVILPKAENPQLVPDVMNLTNTVMQTEAAVVRESNSAGEIFSTIDAYLNKMARLLVPTSKCESLNNGIYMKTVAMASLFFINPLCSNISGVAIFNSANTTGVQQRLFDQHSNNYYHFIYLNQSLEQLLEEPGLQTATYFPFELWSSIANTTGNAILKIMLFKNDVLFVNKTKMEGKPVGGVLEISVIDYRGKLPNALPFIFNKTLQMKASVKLDCGYWNFSTWIRTGINTSHITNTHNEQLLLCNTSHLTPFSFIFLVDLDDHGLDLISTLGCGLSLLGLICIWLTAACFPKWRQKSTNKILLNICFVLTLLMTLFLLLNMSEFKNLVLDMKNQMDCMIMGAFLQYIVLVLFMWMLFIAIRQYQLLAKVFKTQMPSKYITKFFVIAWGFPLIPTSLVAYYQPNSYCPNTESMEAKSAICFPSGYGFYLGVLLPMSVIIVANVSIFVCIICKLLLSNMELKSQRSHQHFLRQIYVSILLFFLLGISWIFGMLAHLERGPVFSYLFCLTSTLQGFVIFIYFIIVNKTTRLTWWNLVCGIKSSNTRI